MAVRNQHFYDRNGSTPYPVVETATSVDDAGVRLPPNVVTDVSLRWPDTLGRYAFVSGVAVTRNVVTLVLQAASAPDAAGEFAPLAVVTVRQPVQEGRVYALAGQAAGVAGWVVFGDGVRNDYAGRFSTPAQSLLAPRAARAYSPIPIAGMRALSASAALTGVVTLKAQAPLAIAREERVIYGLVRDCIVVRLDAGTGLDGVTAAPTAAEDNIFRKFAGPCAGRPESQTCGDPQPVEFVNAVQPDCDGVLTIEFEGCAQVTQLGPDGGVAVDCDLGLIDACLAARIPNDDGELPSAAAPAVIPPFVPPPPPESSPAVSESLSEIGFLPYTDCFTDGTAHDFVTRLGLWEWVPENSPEYLCDDEHLGVSESLSASASASLSQTNVSGSWAGATAAARNLTTWEGFDVQTTFRRVQTDLLMVVGPKGTLHNGGLVLNYREGEAGQVVYFLAEVNYDTQQLVLTRYSGATVQEVAHADVPGLALGAWYRLAAEVVPGASAGQTTVTLTLTSLDGPALSAALSVTTGGYAPSTGRFGLHANRALTRFSYFRVEEAP